MGADCHGIPTINEQASTLAFVQFVLTHLPTKNANRLLWNANFSQQATQYNDVVFTSCWILAYCYY